LHTWLRESHHGLFDFNASADSLQSSSFAIAESMTCYEVPGSIIIQALPSCAATPPHSNALSKCQVGDGGRKFSVDAATPSSNSCKPWLVVRDLPQSTHILEEGDVVMLGRAELHVKQLVVSASDERPLHLVRDTCCPVDMSEHRESEQCRICLMDGCEEDDPLVKPCKCKGSIERVHLSCLRRWVTCRMNLPEGEADSYVFTAPCCEMCMEEFPGFVETCGKKELLTELPRVEPPYIVLESLGKASKTGQKTKVLHHVVSLADNKLLKLGRGHDCGVRIEEVSMSRWHASIRYCDGRFVVEDNSSKFGTMVSLNKPRSLESGSMISVKVGRTVLSLSMPPVERAGASVEGSLASCMELQQSLAVHDVETDGSTSCL